MRHQYAWFALLCIVIQPMVVGTLVPEELIKNEKSADLRFDAEKKSVLHKHDPEETKIVQSLDDSNVPKDKNAAIFPIKKSALKKSVDGNLGDSLHGAAEGLVENVHSNNQLQNNDKQKPRIKSKSVGNKNGSKNKDVKLPLKAEVPGQKDKLQSNNQIQSKLKHQGADKKRVPEYLDQNHDLQRQAELRKQLRENVRRSQESERQEQERYRKDQQFQNQQNQLKKSLKGKDLYNQRQPPVEVKFEVGKSDNSPVKKLQKKEKRVQTVDDNVALIDENKRDEPNQKVPETRGSINNDPNVKLEKDEVKNKDDGIDDKQNDSHEQPINNVLEIRPSPNHPEAQRPPINQNEEKKREEIAEDFKEFPASDGFGVKRVAEDPRDVGNHQNPIPVGQADVKWDGDDFALLFGDSVYMEQKIRRASVPSAGEPWPMPQYIKVRKTHIFKISKQFKFKINEITCDIIEKAVQRYEKYILKYSLPDMHDNLEFAEGSNFQAEDLKYRSPPYTNASALEFLNVRIRTKCTKYPSENMDESYTLVVKKSRMYLSANEVWGALRGLETFSQMVVKGGNSELYIKECLVNDYPRFAHRGVLIDTSRHYIFKEVLYDALEGMAQNKLNVMHWHIVDDQSFPYMSKAFPDLSKKGAFNSDMIYTPSDIADVIEYARLRGIRVVPEFDTPGHTYSWGLGYPDLLTQCYSGPSPVKGYLGPMNPASNYTYDFLRDFFKEVLGVFKDKYIHLGGDEVPLSCWVSNPEILKFSESIGAYGDTRKLMEYYETRLLKILEELALKRKSSIRTVVWQDVIDTVDQLPERVVINVWRGGMPDVQRATSMGHQVIYSTCWYLDLIEYGSRWYKYYLCDPTDPSSGYIEERLVIGGEAALWAEYIDNENLMTTLWPRASATAERLWSHKDQRDVQEAGRRMIEHRCRMLGRGLGVAQISGPDYCPSRGPRKAKSASRLMAEEDAAEPIPQVLDKSPVKKEQLDVRINNRVSVHGKDCGSWATRTSVISHGNGWVLVILTVVLLAAVYFQVRHNSSGYSANRIMKNKTILFSFVTLLVIYVTCYTTIWLQVLDVKRSFLKPENSPREPSVLKE